MIHKAELPQFKVNATTSDAFKAFENKVLSVAQAVTRVVTSPLTFLAKVFVATLQVPANALQSAGVGAFNYVFDGDVLTDPILFVNENWTFEGLGKDIIRTAVLTKRMFASIFYPHKSDASVEKTASSTSYTSPSFSEQLATVALGPLGFRFMTGKWPVLNSELLSTPSTSEESLPLSQIFATTDSKTEISSITMGTSDEDQFSEISDDDDTNPFLSNNNYWNDVVALQNEAKKINDDVRATKAKASREEYEANRKKQLAADQLAKAQKTASQDSGQVLVSFWKES